MGVKQLNKKVELKYRPKSSDACYCGMCKFFKAAKCEDYATMIDSKTENRCAKIGVGGGRQYRINYNYKCDGFERRNV